jgi:DNA-binding NarL/FixJ family response regulator
VDDEPADLEITRIFLKREAKDDFEISGVLSAEEALGKLKSKHFDAIIAHTPFIIFTGKGGAEVARGALNKGADRYIAKNGNPARQCNDLAHAIRELVIEKGEMRVGDL